MHRIFKAAKKCGYLKGLIEPLETRDAKKVAKNKNVSPSGRVFTDDQVKLYYATDGFKKSKLNKANRKSRGNHTKRKITWVLHVNVLMMLTALDRHDSDLC